MTAAFAVALPAPEPCRWPRPQRRQRRRESWTAIPGIGRSCGWRRSVYCGG